MNLHYNFFLQTRFEKFGDYAFLARGALYFFLVFLLGDYYQKVISHTGQDYNLGVTIIILSLGLYTGVKSFFDNNSYKRIYLLFISSLSTITLYVLISNPSALVLLWGILATLITVIGAKFFLKWDNRGDKILHCLLLASLIGVPLTPGFSIKYILYKDFANSDLLLVFVLSSIFPLVGIKWLSKQIFSTPAKERENVHLRQRLIQILFIISIVIGTFTPFISLV